MVEHENNKVISLVDVFVSLEEAIPHLERAQKETQQITIQEGIDIETLKELRAEIEDITTRAKHWYKYCSENIT